MISLLAVALWSVSSVQASATVSNSPYIDELKQGMKSDSEQAPADTGSYTQELKKKFGADPSGKTSYINELKQETPENYTPRPQDAGFIESEKKSLPSVDPRTTGSGAIQAVQENRSQLKPYKPGHVQYAAGLKLGASNTQTVTTSGGASNRTFRDFYGTGWFPDLQAFGEWQVLRDESWGSLGLTGSLGFSLQTGKGKFAIRLTKPNGELFPEDSQTSLRFMTFPALAGMNLRLNLMRWVRPYIQGGLGAVVFAETRSDSGKDKRGYSRVVHGTAGINILLDPIFPRETWDVYEGYSTKHYYLTLDYTTLKTISGNVNFQTSTIGVGVTHEF